MSPKPFHSLQEILIHLFSIHIINVELHYASVLLRVLLVSLSDLIVFTVIVGLSYYIKISSKRAFLEVINVI